MTRALQTRQVGLTTHASGHVMAPPDLVYEVEEEPKRKMRSPLWARILIPICALYLAYALVRTVVFMLSGVTI